MHEHAYKILVEPRRVMIFMPTKEEIGAPVDLMQEDLQQQIDLELERERAFEARG